MNVPYITKEVNQNDVSKGQVEGRWRGQREGSALNGEVAVIAEGKC